METPPTVFHISHTVLI